jgi:hypothetical protein
MIKIFTQDDILRYVYQETTPEESTEIELALYQDSDLYQYYHQVRSLSSRLDSIECTPAEKTLQHIFRYSRSTNPQIREQTITL